MLGFIKKWFIELLSTLSIKRFGESLWLLSLKEV